MHVLFVHPNFPGQFRFIAPALARDGWTCTFATTRADRALAGVSKVVYRQRWGATGAHHFTTRPFQNATGQADAVYRALKDRPDIQPDLVVAHSGFGSSLFLPYLYDAPIINFFEWFYRPVGQDLGYRPGAGGGRPASGRLGRPAGCHGRLAGCHGRLAGCHGRLARQRLRS